MRTLSPVLYMCQRKNFRELPTDLSRRHICRRSSVYEIRIEHITKSERQPC